jgi:hypothetical protein
VAQYQPAVLTARVESKRAWDAVEHDPTTSDREKYVRRDSWRRAEQAYQQQLALAPVGGNGTAVD